MKAQPQRLPRLQAALPAAEEAWPGLCRRRFLVPVACPLPHCCLLRLLAPPSPPALVGPPPLASAAAP